MKGKWRIVEMPDYQADYLDMVEGYARYHGLGMDPEELRAEALEWATTRGGRAASGCHGVTSSARAVGFGNARRMASVCR